MSPGRIALISLLAVSTPPVLAQRVTAPATAITPSQQPAQAPPNSTGPIFTLHATARLVVLDVTVTDDHGPVKNLKPSDFTLSEDGVEQHILSVTEHDASDIAPPAPEPILPPNTFATHPPISGEIPKVVIVLGGLSFPDAPFVRDELRAFSKTVAPGTPIAIFSIDWKGLHLIQSLTTDPAAIEEAASSQRIIPPLGFSVRYLRHVGSPTQQLAHYLAAVPGRINLVWFGSGEPNAHNEGFFASTTGGIPPDLAAFVAHENAASSVLHLSRIALYPVIAGGLVGNFGPAPDILAASTTNDEDLVGLPAAVLLTLATERANSFGLSGTAMDSYAAGLDMKDCQYLMETANSTGGKGYCNTNGFKEALTDVVTIGSHYYTISYSPSNANWNGAFRHIKVDVAPVLPTTSMGKLAEWIEPLNGKVLYRDGYFARTRPERPAPDLTAGNSIPANAATPDQQRKLISYSTKGDPDAMQTAMAFGMAMPLPAPVGSRSRHLRRPKSTIPASRSPKITSSPPPCVTSPSAPTRFTTSSRPKDLQFTQTPGGYTDTLEFAAVAYRDDGLPANSIDYTAHIDVNPTQYAQIMAKGLNYDQTIAIPITELKDNFFLRAGVHELPTNRIGAIEIPSEWIKLPPSENNHPDTIATSALATRYS